MAAVFDVVLDLGGSDGSPGTPETVTNLRWRTDDDNTQDATNPVPIVTGQTKYSYWRHIFLKCTTAPTTKVDNCKFYSDGSNFGTGITLNVAEQFPTKNALSDAGYEVADGTPGDTGTEMVSGHTGVSSVVDLHTKTLGSPLAGPSISEAGSLIDAIDETTNYIITQLKVEDTASPQQLTPDTFSVQYDEI